MATQHVKVEGLRELLNALRELPKELRGPAARRALHSGAKVTRQRARAIVQKDTGFLAESIVSYSVKRGEHQYDEQVRVGVLKRARKRVAKKIAAARTRRQARGASASGIKTPFYWRFLEFGTSKMAARPFLRPAFESTKFDANERIKKAMRENIEKAARKVAKV